MVIFAYGGTYTTDDSLGVALVVGAFALIGIGVVLGYLVGHSRAKANSAKPRKKRSSK